MLCGFLFNYVLSNQVNDSTVVCTVNCNMDAMHFKGDEHLGLTKFVISIVNPESSVEMLILSMFHNIGIFAGV